MKHMIASSTLLQSNKKQESTTPLKANMNRTLVNNGSRTKAILRKLLKRTHPMILRGDLRKRTHSMTLRPRCMASSEVDQSASTVKRINTMTPRKLAFSSTTPSTFYSNIKVKEVPDVDSEFLLQQVADNCRVVSVPSFKTKFYDALLCFVQGTSDKFYIIQVIQFDDPKACTKYVCFTRWGRTGSRGQTQTFGPFDNVADAVKAFEGKFNQKTLNTFENYCAGKFVRVGHKYDCPCAPVARSVRVARENGVNWEYEIPRDYDVPGKVKGWYSYDPRNADEVETLYQALVLGSSPSSSYLAQRTIVSDTSMYSYHVDLAAMQQTNQQTGKLRNIRRVNPQNCSL